MIFFQDDLTRAALLAKIETERALFQEWHAPQLARAKKNLNRIIWAKHHPFLLAASFLTLYALLPRPKFKKIKTAWWIYQKSQRACQWFKKL